MTIGLVLALIFIVLKLTGTIAWSWLWVVSPVFIELGLQVLFVGLTAVIIAALGD